MPAYLKIVWIKEDGVGDVELSGHDVGDDVGQAEDVVVVAEVVPVRAQLLVVQLGPLVLDRQIVNNLKFKTKGV